MNPDRQLPPLAIDAGSFPDALAAGAVDDCLSFLRWEHPPPDAAAELNCRLAETLFYSERRDEALECGRRALAEAGTRVEILDFCAWLFSNCDRQRDAAMVYERILGLRPDWIEGYRHLSGAFAAAGETAAAIATGIQAADIAPERAEYALHVGELLIRSGRYHEAAAIIERAASYNPDEPQLQRTLSGIEMLRGNVEGALAAIDRAIDAAPDVPEYWLHRAHLLLKLSDAEGAAASVDYAAALDGDAGAVRRAGLEVLLARGDVTGATAWAGDLLALCPDDEQAAEAARRVLERRLDTIDGDYVVHVDRARLAREPAGPPKLVASLAAQWRVIVALMIREMRTRFGDSRLGYGWAVLEPILHLCLLWVVFAIVMPGRPPLGTHFFVFYFTGLVPYLVFVHSSGAMAHAITGNGPLLQLPLVKTFDVVLARGLLELATDIVVAVLLLAGLGAFGLAATPDDVWEPSLALLATGLLGFGVGFINAVITVFHRGWDKVFAQITRALYFCSGIFRYYPAKDQSRSFRPWLAFPI